MGFLPGMLTFLQVCLFLWGWGRVQAGLTSSLVAVMRTQGSLRLILNTKLWAQMQMDKASEKSIRITAMDTEDQGVKVFLISVSSPGHRPGGCQTQAGSSTSSTGRLAQGPGQGKQGGLQGQEGWPARGLCDPLGGQALCLQELQSAALRAC